MQGRGRTTDWRRPPVQTSRTDSSVVESSTLKNVVVTRLQLWLPTRVCRRQKLQCFVNQWLNMVAIAAYATSQPKLWRLPGPCTHNRLESARMHMATLISNSQPIHHHSTGAPSNSQPMQHHTTTTTRHSTDLRTCPSDNATLGNPPEGASGRCPTR
jgi:hypothetical protein